ncbi:type II toxin-antitoxin system RelE/ParE family toxin [Okibacterium fritillariae]|uniref:RelE-like toxin of type II toxin-antitoxin system HigB n=1 Tax=Okibacterium fritillariae TaxID=123320 RepID=A0A1T5J0B1_9MICO|nr:type II toxin-antitoxin system RelE/ParE family toxin [Okibacterium fritillariae]SKC44899.1 RelE-like toxin of type II toxin-antitoxin system HigB [Okibacterium fritillariae]
MALRQSSDRRAELRDLRVPPGDRLEQVSADRRGERSIRINDQWRLCFLWSPAGPTDVEITDYRARRSEG